MGQGSLHVVARLNTKPVGACMFDAEEGTKATESGVAKHKERKSGCVLTLQSKGQGPRGWHIVGNGLHGANAWRHAAIVQS